MSPFPVRCDSNASHLPSGEYIGCAFVAGSAISRCAAPPCAATVQIAPPEANAIVAPSGDSAGCVLACVIGACARAAPAASRRATASFFIRRWYHPYPLFPVPYSPSLALVLCPPVDSNYDLGLAAAHLLRSPLRQLRRLL